MDCQECEKLETKRVVGEFPVRRGSGELSLCAVTKVSKDWTSDRDTNGRDEDADSGAPRSILRTIMMLVLGMLGSSELVTVNPKPFKPFTMDSETL